jgi:hypothetical protein
MVNHFATLLLNESGEKIDIKNKSYFTDRNYNKLLLPTPIARVYDLILPRDSTFYYKQFLCYVYLRILQATNSTAFALSLDPRISYDLDLLQEYFRLSRVSAPSASDFNYALLVSGSFVGTRKKNYYYDRYTVKQIGTLPEVAIYCDTDQVYLNGSREEDHLTEAMHIPLILDSHSNYSTKQIDLGGTGLNFVITGELSKFAETADKYWSFVVDTPSDFNFNQVFSKIAQQPQLVDKLFEYSDTGFADKNYIAWQTHFNPLYRFSAFLNAYVERVNALWEKQAT